MKRLIHWFALYRKCSYLYIMKTQHTHTTCPGLDMRIAGTFTPEFQEQFLNEGVAVSYDETDALRDQLFAAHAATLSVWNECAESNLPDAVLGAIALRAAKYICGATGRPSYEGEDAINWALWQLEERGLI